PGRVRARRRARAPAAPLPERGRQGRHRRQPGEARPEVQGKIGTIGPMSSGRGLPLPPDGPVAAPDNFRRMSTETALNLQTGLFIGGEFVPSASGKKFATTNPATGEPIAEVSEAGREDLDRAVAGARKSFESGPWAAMKPRQRGRILQKAAELLLSRAEEFGRVETLDNGKPIFEAAQIDMPAAAECLAHFGQA